MIESQEKHIGHIVNFVEGIWRWTKSVQQLRKQSDKIHWWLSIWGNKNNFVQAHSELQRN